MLLILCRTFCTPFFALKASFLSPASPRPNGASLLVCRKKLPFLPLQQSDEDQSETRVRQTGFLLASRRVAARPAQTEHIYHDAPHPALYVSS